MLELVEFRPARCMNAKKLVYRSPEVVVRELVQFAENAESSVFTHIGKVPILVKPGEALCSVTRRYHREVRSMKRWMERRSGSDRRQYARDDGRERRNKSA